MQDYQAMLLKGVCTLALLQGTWALTSPLKRLRRATTVTKGANVGLASLKPADLKIAGSAACGSYIQGYTTGVLGGYGRKASLTALEAHRDVELKKISSRFPHVRSTRPGDSPTFQR